jgi:hypothetical protein
MAQTGTPNPAQVANFVTSQDGTGNHNTYAGSRDLLLKTFGGEVMTHYDERFIMKGLVRSRTVPRGSKTVQFPAIGQAAAEHFIPGQQILGQAMKTDEKTIAVDDLLVSSVFINNIDEMLSHIPFRAEYAKQIGAALAKTCELKIIQSAVRDARLGDQYNAAQVPGKDTPFGAASGAGKGIVDMENAVTKHVGTSAGAAELLSTAFEAAAYFDEHDMPMEGRVLLVSPTEYYNLINSTDTRVVRLLNKDFSQGNGDFAGAAIAQVAGFNLVKTNNLQVDGTANTNTGPDGRTPLNAPAGGFGQDYATNATDSLGLFLHGSGIGLATVQDITTESEYYVDRQGSLLVSKLMNGVGTLRPDALFEVRKAADAV